MQYITTRGEAGPLNASGAILRGLADDGGLYVPESFPRINNLQYLTGLSYSDLAYEILRLFLTDYTDGEIRACCDAAYGKKDEKFDTPAIAPLVSGGGYHFLELFHGPTLAFKDMALSILPSLLTLAAKKHRIDQKVVILTATSGDTGKAALEGFANLPNIDIFVFYPHNGVSAMQQLQMTTQEGANTHVIAVRGNFDDAQTGVKAIFNKNQFNDVYLTSANSINIGRLLPQIVYYVYAYGQMVRARDIAFGSPINFTVPTGNFGNILACYYARQMGLPIKNLLCASNDNRVLYDFFVSGIYNKNREFFVTASPSMDILVSSNLERLLFHMSDARETREAMSALSLVGKYDFLHEKSGFEAMFATRAESFFALKRLFVQSGRIVDPHTAVALAAYEKYAEQTGDDTPNVIISTASPFKFPESVLNALEKPCDPDPFANIKTLREISGHYPRGIMELQAKKIRHTDACMPYEMEQRVRDALQ
ncbi:MAG: threonine synthase [Clostridiales bacterium]|jgi:threonine synthase|nr:threonine synthase [Clostridiales bacterium]